MKYQVVTIGAATQDVFLISKNFAPKRLAGDWYNVLRYGSKINVEEIFYDTGGGATNAAVTFARQGLKTGCIAKIGLDAAGREIVHVLEKEHVHTEHLIKKTTHHTGFSVLLKPPTGDRTVLVHRGASAAYQKKDFALSKLDAAWLYVTSLAGDFASLKMIIEFAHRRGIYVAINPGGLELKSPRRLLPLLKKVQITIMNRDEAAKLTGTDEPRASLKALKDHGLYSVLMTDGPNGSYCLYGDRMYRCGLYKKVRVVDRNGAGDAAGSGFLAALLRGRTIEEALSFASANSTSVIGFVGAKTGILRTHDVKTLKVEVNAL